MFVTSFLLDWHGVERDAKRCCSAFEKSPEDARNLKAWPPLSPRLNQGVVTMPAKEKTLEDLFLHTLKDIFYAEKQILKALPRMAKNAESEELAQAFETHRLETEGQIERLEKVFEMLGKPARGVQCEAINGIIEEGKEVMEDFADSEALDAGILAAAQAVEHYEITRYGSLKTWAQELGMADAAKLLDQNLQEEKKTDQLLTQLAEARVNTKAA
jgi:ferritin-like metal-binding protein YciE